MSAPAAIANAVADALGRDDVELPLTPPRVWELLRGEVKPAPFEYVRARSLEEALAALAEGGEEAKALAGGQSLVPVLNYAPRAPGVLVDINRAGPRRSRRTARVRRRDRPPAGLRGARVRWSSGAPVRRPLVTRNRGTVGGSIAHADAAAELPLCLPCSAATVRTSTGRRAPRGGLLRHALHDALGRTSCWSNIWPARPARSASRSSPCGTATSRSRCRGRARGEAGTSPRARGVGAVPTGRRSSPTPPPLAGAPATRRRARRRRGRRGSSTRPGTSTRRPLPPPLTGASSSARVERAHGQIELTVNGRAAREEVEPRLLLSDFLRHRSV